MLDPPDAGRAPRHGRLSVWGTLMCFLLVGCNSPTVTVEGTVTLDQKPLAGANISFVPTRAGGQSLFAVTDSQGKYACTVSIDDAALLPTEYTVRISTFDPGVSEVTPPVPAKPERVPVKYNEESQLKKTIELGPNRFDFPLDSNGRIVQPRGDSSDI